MKEDKVEEDKVEGDKVKGDKMVGFSFLCGLEEFSYSGRVGRNLLIRAGW